ncbi:MAG: outer membrane beta-barrel protein [Gemmatimonadetes bacterium]|nr:outer membrane beta-barrel protein [Gemmatimonadota bacterium]
MRKSFLFLSIAGLIAWLPPAAALATDIEEKWLVGVGLGSSHLGTEEDPGSEEGARIKETGAGGNIVAGYGFGPVFAMRASVGGTRHETERDGDGVNFGNFGLEFLGVFRDLETFRPYLMGGVGYFSLKTSEGAFDFETTGGGLIGGGGFYYFFSDLFALDVGLRLDFIQWETAKATLTFEDGSSAEVALPISEEGTAAEIRVAASWWIDFS